MGWENRKRERVLGTVLSLGQDPGELKTKVQKKQGAKKGTTFEESCSNQVARTTIHGVLGVDGGEEEGRPGEGKGEKRGR